MARSESKTDRSLAQALRTSELNHVRFEAALASSGLFTAEDVPALGRSDRSPAEWAQELVEEGYLTEFQASKLLRGQWHGLVLGRYTILAPLGRGGMGIVYLAREHGPLETRYERPLIALKILPPRKADHDPHARMRFLREMDVGAQVPHHPHIARVLEAGQANQVHFIAMEFVPGETLRTVVLSEGKLAVPLATRILAEVAEGLHAAHESGMVHRDMKPSNIMVNMQGQVKLLDFGLALRLDEPTPDDPVILGGPGYALGTMDYMAPEQARNALAVTPASDQYSLGCTLYFALAGCPPFPGGSQSQKIRWHRSEQVPNLRQFNPAVPDELHAVILKLLAKTPEARFSDCRVVAQHLRQWAEAGVTRLPVAQPVATESPVVLTEDDLWDEEDSLGQRPAQPGFTWPEIPPALVRLAFVGLSGVAFLVCAILAAFVIRSCLRG